MSEDCTANAGPPVRDLKHLNFTDCKNLNIVRMLGKGAIGKVYLVSAEDETETTMAVKTFALGKDVAARSRREFRREVHFMQTLSHPHLVPCYFAAEYRDCLTIAMPFYEGGDLKTVWENQLHDIPTIHRNILEVSAAVNYLHDKSVAHKDIKLNNVFLDGSGRAVLGDFGFARTISSKDLTLPVGMMGGAKGYWSPERFHAEHWTPVNPFKCDVYALGVMTWLLVSNGKLGLRVNYIERLRDEHHLPMPLALRSAMERMLEPNPEKRATAAETMVNLLSAV